MAHRRPEEDARRPGRETLRQGVLRQRIGGHRHGTVGRRPTRGPRHLTHTPSPMGFLANCLGASEHERPFVLIPIGWPHPNAMVPDQERKPLDDILTIH